MKIKNNVKDFALYLLVGGIATLTEWLFFHLFSNVLSLHYALATVFAYIISTFVNWGAGRILVFKTGTQNVLKELVQIYLAGIVGLALNLFMMLVFVETMKIEEMISKIIATGMVFVFNFLIRKLLIYKEQ